MLKLLQETIKLKAITQHCELGPSSLTYAIKDFFSMKENLLRNIHNLTTMVARLVSISLNKPIVACLNSKLLFDRKLTTNRSCALTNIHRSKVHVVERHVANTSCTYVIKLFSTKVGRTSSTNTLFDKKQHLGITCKPFDVTKWIQLLSLVKNLLSHITLHLPRKQFLGLMVFCKLVYRGKKI
jgi:hypothetical protein